MNRLAWLVLSLSLPLAAFGEEGFFKPAADPALTSFRPAPPRTAATTAANPPAEARDTAEEIRVVEERQLDRAEREHAVATERAARYNPVTITSPLDGTAPIRSPLDGTAPIISPLSR